MQPDFDYSSFDKELEALGAEEVRLKLSKGYWSFPAHEAAKCWLSYEEARLSSIAFKRAEERSDESLSISRQALDNSRLATRIAISAIILTISITIFEIIKWYSLSLP